MEETWNNISGYEGLYQINKLGQVKSLAKEWISGKGAKRVKNETILKPLTISDGYKSVILHKNKVSKQFKIHRLVATTFIPNPENKPQVNHKNGVRDDNRAENLEWVTIQENSNHKWGVLKYKPSKETCEKIRISKLGNKNRLGIKHSLESKMKISENSYLNKGVLCLHTGLYFNSITEYCKQTNRSRYKLKYHIQINKNNYCVIF